MSNQEGQKVVRELWAIDLGEIDYMEALELQRRIVAAKKAGTFEPELLLLLEHPAVITLGRRGDASNVVAPPETLAERGIPVYNVERGGDVTYHGPGQLVGYPIVSLRHLPNRKDVGKFVWNMQEAIIRTLASHAIVAERIDKVIGVWVRRPTPSTLPSDLDEATRARLRGSVLAFPERKIAAIGARVEGWVSFHGFALNVNTHLDDFNLIVPCGLEDRGVTSMEIEVGQKVPLPAIKKEVAQHLAELWGFDLVWKAPAGLADFFTDEG